MRGLCFAFFNFPGKIFRKQLTIRQSAGIIIPVVRHGTNIWGISSAGRALAWHARGHRFDPGILHQKEKHRTAVCGAFLFVRNFCLSQTSEALAQLGERLHGMQEVTGSIPVFSTKKSTVLRRKYGAFLFSEADFWGLHCFACTVFRLLQAVPIQPPMVFHKFGTISASLPSTLPAPSRDDLTGAQGRRVTSPINRLRGRVSRRRTDDRQKLLQRFPTISAYKKMR